MIISFEDTGTNLRDEVSVLREHSYRYDNRLCHVRSPFAVSHKLVVASLVVGDCCRYRNALFSRCYKHCLSDRGGCLLAKMK